MGEFFDIAGYFRFVAALVAVLGLILITAHLAKRFLHGRVALAKAGAGRRLSVSEVLPLDARRRVVLLRRDGQEHLVLIGPDGDTVIERDIAAPEREAGGGGTMKSVATVESIAQGPDETAETERRPRSLKALLRTVQS